MDSKSIGESSILSVRAILLLQFNGQNTWLRTKRQEFESLRKYKGSIWSWRLVGLQILWSWFDSNIDLRRIFEIMELVTRCRGVRFFSLALDARARRFESYHLDKMGNQLSWLSTAFARQRQEFESPILHLSAPGAAQQGAKEILQTPATEDQLSWLERLFYMQDVIGSNPISSTILPFDVTVSITGFEPVRFGSNPRGASTRRVGRVGLLHRS